MHTITICPICGNDFMYHWSDVNLNRTMTFIDEVGVNEIKDVVICQNCDEIENISLFIEEKAEHRGWENAECMAIDKFGEEKTSKAMKKLFENKTN